MEEQKNLHIVSKDGALRTCNTFSDRLDIDKPEYSCGLCTVQVLTPYDCEIPTLVVPKFKFVILVYDPRLPATK